MRSLVCVLYILATVYYVTWAPDSYFWHGFNIVSIILFGAAATAFAASKVRVTENERLLLWYMVGWNIARAIYTCFCIHANVIERTSWKPYATSVFISLTVITLLLFLVYLARRKE